MAAHSDGKVWGGPQVTMTASYAAPTISSSLKSRAKFTSQPLHPNLFNPKPPPPPPPPPPPVIKSVEHSLICPQCLEPISLTQYDDHVLMLCPQIIPIIPIIPTLNQVNFETPFTKDTVGVSDEEAAVALTRELEMEDLLTPCQASALKHVQSVAAQLSNHAKPMLITRCQLLGYSLKEVETTLRYIRLIAPIVVHLDLDMVLEPLSRDRYLRNQFETKTSKGNLDPDHKSRILWEHNIFKGLYDTAQGYERPKYGSINITADPAGVYVCQQYGDSYLLMRNIRFRTTFCSQDSSQSLTVNDMATCEHYAHVLNQYANIELGAIIEVANGRKEYLSSNLYVHTYKEAQMAGPIRLDRDIEALVVHPRHAIVPGRVDKLALFARKNNCKLLWINHPHPKM
jgi:hypothetical protein